MMLVELAIWTCFALAAIPTGLLVWNLPLLRRLPAAASPSSPQADNVPAVSVLIPARDEEHTISGALEAVLASRGVELEAIVLDDHSTDRTAAIVLGLAQRDPRVRLIRGEPLPEGWIGKQHACHQLSRHARHELMLFVDADVRLEPDALARMAREMQRSNAAMLSGVPRQQVGTWLEKLVVPLIHLVLVCYLPLARMRQSTSPAFGAACGQLIMVRREAYRRAGGHQSIASCMHDGVKLPRVLRQAGYMTDLCDATDLARCRMYHNAGEVWRGFLKNATEGLATPAGLPVWSVLLLGGHVLPWVLVLAQLSGSLRMLEPAHVSLIWGAWVMSASTSFALMHRFEQPWTAGILRPMGVVILLAIQWWAMLLKLAGRSSAWKGRAYAAK